MNIKLTSAIAFLLALFSVLSCRQNESISDKKRNDLSLKSELEQKKIFMNLDTDSKIKLWTSKLDQIKSQDISDEQKRLISKISDELSKMNNDNFDGQKLFGYAIKMAQITPEDEFIRMFSTLSDYKINKNSYDDLAVGPNSKISTKSNIESDLINYLSKIKESKIKFNETQNKNNDISTTSIRKDCNCRWTCMFYTPGGTNDDCRNTDSGCGFLWLQECNRFV